MYTVEKQTAIANLTPGDAVMPATEYIKNRRAMLPVEEAEGTEEEVTEAPKKRHAPGTSEFVTLKLPQSLYKPLKTIAGLTNKKTSELLELVVAKGIDEFRNLTIDELLSK
jgi:hypothetical protein